MLFLIKDKTEPDIMDTCEKIIFSFVNLLKKFKVTSFPFFNGCSKFGLISINGYFNIKKFKGRYEKSFASFKYALNYKLTGFSKERILMILVNTRSDLNTCKKLIDRKYQKHLERTNYDTCSCDGKEHTRLLFSKNRYKSRKEFNCHKVQLAHKIQSNYIDRALKLIARHAVNIDLSIIPENQDNNINENTEPNIVFTFDGTGDFTIWFYSMFLAGFINNGEGNITKLHNELAEKLGVKLSDNWQSNLSKTIHNTNFDYTPKVLESLIKSFKKYREDMIDKYRRL